MTTPPRCLGAVDANFLMQLSDPIRTCFVVKCPRCRGGMLSVDETAAGDRTVGLIIICQSCGGEALPFDSREHGYDGELGYNKHLTGAMSRTALSWSDGKRKCADRLIVRFSYDVDMSELQEIADESGVNLVDLFDWVQVVEDDPRNSDVIWDFECA